MFYAQSASAVVSGRWWQHIARLALEGFICSQLLALLLLLVLVLLLLLLPLLLLLLQRSTAVSDVRV